MPRSTTPTCSRAAIPHLTWHVAMRKCSVARVLVASSLLAASVAVVDASALFVPHSPLALGRRSPSQRWQWHNFSIRARGSLEESETRDAHVFLRLSPLIGGPALVPLHVELIFAVEDAGAQQIQQSMDTIYVRKINNLSSTSFLKDASQLHRFDFLPKNPTEASTLARLLTLRGVPGRVRYRYRKNAAHFEGLNHNLQSDSSDDKMKSQDGTGITILIPVGSIACTDEEETGVTDVVSTAIRFKDEYSDTLFRELRILGGKNCFSFVLDLLSHVESNSELRKINRLNKLDID